jgi:uncharacterized low-complexity protein
MKALKMVLIACSLSAVAVAAHAQTSAPATSAQQFAQNQQQSHEQRPSGAAHEGRVAAPSKKAEDCVGPASFCNLFFGS